MSAREGEDLRAGEAKHPDAASLCTCNPRSSSPFIDAHHPGCAYVLASEERLEQHPILPPRYRRRQALPALDVEEVRRVARAAYDEGWTASTAARTLALSRTAAEAWESSTACAQLAAPAGEAPQPAPQQYLPPNVHCPHCGSLGADFPEMRIRPAPQQDAVERALEEVEAGLERIAASNVLNMDTLHPDGCGREAERLLNSLTVLRAALAAQPAGWREGVIGECIKAVEGVSIDFHDGPFMALGKALDRLRALVAPDPSAAPAPEPKPASDFLRIRDLLRVLQVMKDTTAARSLHAKHPEAQDGEHYAKLAFSEALTAGIADLTSKRTDPSAPAREG